VPHWGVQLFPDQATAEAQASLRTSTRRGLWGGAPFAPRPPRSSSIPISSGMGSPGRW
jgi:hypothetical protein